MIRIRDLIRRVAYNRLDDDWAELKAMTDIELIAEFQRLGPDNNPLRFQRAVEVMGLRFYENHMELERILRERNRTSEKVIDMNAPVT